MDVATRVNTAEIIEVLLDPKRLGDLIGQPVHATRIRIKPGVSVVGAVSGAPDLAWIRFLWPIQHRRGSRILDWAVAHGHAVHHHDLGRGIVVQWGSLDTDPGLAKHLWAAARAGILGSGTDEQVLRHNPLRRAVIRAGQRVVRVTARRQAPGHRFDTFLETRVPVPRRLDDGQNPHLSVRCLVGGTDLARHRDPGTGFLVGRTLARLHASSTSASPALLAELGNRGADPFVQVMSNAAIIGEIDAELANRIRRAGKGVPPFEDRSAICHGDATPDQVLYDPGSGRLWLTDFDRVCLDDGVIDLGSYVAAVDEPTGQNVLAGYERAGGGRVDPDLLRIAVVRALLLRLAEPLRAAEPDWRGLIARRLDRIEGLM